MSFLCFWNLTSHLILLLCDDDSLFDRGGGTRQDESVVGKFQKRPPGRFFLPDAPNRWAASPLLFSRNQRTVWDHIWFQRSSSPWENCFIQRDSNWFG